MVNVLVIGASGLFGSCLFRHLAGISHLQVTGTVRGAKGTYGALTEFDSKLLYGIELTNSSKLELLVSKLNPDFIVNCAGETPRAGVVIDEGALVSANSTLPHQLAHIALKYNAKVIHISSDAVFSGKTGNYLETDKPSPVDSYGQSKLLGELPYHHCLTIRTSIIGHSPSGTYGLVDWFLNQRVEAVGYKNALFSGFPAIELAHIVSNFFLGQTNLSGILHLAAQPISKIHLLELISIQYGHLIKIKPYELPVIDRTLNAARFLGVSGYTPPTWVELVEKMYLSRSNYLLE
jgi:dTDP-4-dehydrorhamnose reductase